MNLLNISIKYILIITLQKILIKSKVMFYLGKKESPKNLFMNYIQKVCCKKKVEKFIFNRSTFDCQQIKKMIDQYNTPQEKFIVQI
ncbi:hypothetical protein pb186bvf_006861 [Paramecium bursaria]